MQPLIAGNHPLRGPNIDSLGPRFPPMSDAYDSELHRMADKCAKEMGIENRIRHGAYAMVSGPSYETMIECRYLRQIGADSVGMSTAPEVVVARHSGMQVLGMSFITNKVITIRGPNQVHASHAEVLAAAEAAGPLLVNLVKAVIVSPEFKVYLENQPNYEFKAAKPAHPITPMKSGGSLLPNQPCRRSDESSGVSMETILAVGLFAAAAVAYFKGRK
jgi:hypothetical protein